MMQYSNIGEDKISRLGFGCMRFAKDEKTGEIDKELVGRMFDRAIESGVNYFDTAYPYLDAKSEIVVGEMLKKYPRESYFLADKFPGHSMPKPIDNIELFNVQLKKCGTDYFDYYLLHNINEQSISVYEGEEYHIIPDIIKMKEAGKIRHPGFSFHGGVELLKKVLDKYEGVFEFVQIQLNYLDWTLQKAKEKYDLITEKGLSVIVMEPCRGGKLASLPGTLSEKLDPRYSDASYAFRFVSSLPNVKVILSGMNSMEQVCDNLDTFNNKPALSGDEIETLMAIAEELKNSVPCTGCRYCCDGCPMGLNIPFLLECFNSLKFDRDISTIMRLDSLAEDKKPKSCIACGKCSHSCPQKIDVPAVLKELSAIYANGPMWSDMSKARQQSILKDLGEE